MNETESTTTARPVRALRACRDWLANVPVADAVDRRNAPTLQIVLLVLVFASSLLWLYRIGFSGVPWRAGETASLLMSLCIVVVATASFLLIRRGRFQWATRQLLVVVAILLVAAYLQSGLDAQGYEQPLQVVWLVLAGLVVGRPALWAMYAVFVLAFASGVGVDIASDLAAADAAKFSAADRIGNGVIAAVIFLLIAIVIDRSVSALRAALREANERGDQLARANARLHEEIAGRERVTEQLIHARKVEAVGHLASGVAHDFNHLLGLVLGYARRGSGADDIDEARKALSGVESAAHRATAVARTLLNFSRREATRLETFDANAALVEAQPMLAQLFGPRVHLSIETSPAPAWIRFDRSQFTLIVLNIATNANQAMADGGSFRIAVDAGGTGVGIAFGDSGHGMSADVRQRIFEPFFTTRPAGHGTGLGLAVAADLVGAAGGGIDVHSAPGAGTTLRLTLPHADPASGVHAGSDVARV